MKLLSVLLLFATMWFMAIAWHKDLNDILFQEYLENENQANPSDRFRLLMEKVARDDETAPRPRYFQDAVQNQEHFVHSNLEMNNALAEESGPSNFRHVGSLDMDIPGMSCPSPLQLRTFGSNRLCEKNSGNSCASVTISVDGQSYTQVRGKVAAYAYNTPDAFRRLHGAGSGINDPYVDGISITYGSPRNHVWTYAASGGTLSAYTCPEIGDAITKQPAFVGLDYICVVASKLVAKGGDNLFDVPIFTTLGNCVGDCPDDLAFCVTLDESTSDDLELRICTDQSKTDEDIFLKSYDFYIQ